MSKQIKSEWKKAQGVVTDRAAALGEITFNVGSLIGPIIGGALTDAYGYRGMCDIIVVAALSMAVLNFCVIFLPEICLRRQEKEKILNMKFSIDATE